ncbi:hypothetical protein WHR41_09405 [Cladosporium halotolerans]|uniref:DRBM domain-containing protein n=1 Tax=Cladosporium halotolerans TaxID=1052096 RepID=A0AB34KA95_9PEZI
MSSPFEYEVTRSHHPSDDGLSDDSNFEHLSSERTANTANQENLYWLGKRVLDSRLARHVVIHSAATATPDDLKMELIRLKASIPYAARLALIGSARTHPPGEAGVMTRASDFRTYCVAIGRLTISDGERELRRLVEGEGSSDEREPTEINRPASGGQPARQDGDVYFEDPGVPLETNIAHYSMALKEYGDRVGKEARCDIERSPVNPLLFSARVYVNGSQHQGLGRTKKQAKHLANRAACRAIGIVV